MTVLDATERKIKWGTGTLNACMAGSCLVVLPILPALPFPGMLLPAGAVFGGLSYASYRWRQASMGGLVALAGAKSAHGEALPESHPASVAVRRASELAGIKRPRTVIAEDCDVLSICYGEDVIAFDRRFLAAATPDELLFAAGHELARARFAGREKRIDTRHHITQIFNYTTRVLYFGLVTGITALNTAAWMLHTSTSLSTDTVNASIPLLPQYMLAGLSTSAMIAFLTRGAMLRNITHACDLQAVRAAGTIAGAESLLGRIDSDYPLPHENALAGDIRWVGRQPGMRRLSGVFNLAAALVESLPLIVSRPVNAFLALGQDRRPRTKKRLRLLRAYARETGLARLPPPAKPEEKGALPPREGGIVLPAPFAEPLLQQTREEKPGEKEKSREAQGIPAEEIAAEESGRPAAKSAEPTARKAAASRPKPPEL
jgi:hypothetical protein